MAPVLRFNRTAIEDRIEQAASYLGIAGGFDGFYDFSQELRESLGIPEKLAALGVGTDRLDELTAMALEDPSVGGNPVKMDAANTRALFEAAI